LLNPHIFASTASEPKLISDYTGYAVSTVKTQLPKRGIGKNPIPRSRRSPWTECTSRGVRILQVNALNKLPWLVHGFSTRPGGVSPLVNRPAVAQEKVEKVLNLGFVEWDTRENVLENRHCFQSALGAADFTLVPLKQVHSDVMHVFEAAPAEPCRGLPAQAGDASATDRPGLLLGVQTADCVPILLVDPKKRAVAAVHAGWRGTLQRIVMKAIGRMHMQFGTRPADLLAALGPAIGGCCYEVGTEVASAFVTQFPNAAEWFDELRTGDEPNPLQWLTMMPPGHQPPPKNVFLDLRKANRAQLLDAGLREKNIFVSDLCTACRRDLLFSYRKEGAQSGRLMSVIGVRK
jgi:YfiH family protein